MATSRQLTMAVVVVFLLLAGSRRCVKADTKKFAAKNGAACWAFTKSDEPKARNECNKACNADSGGNCAEQSKKQVGKGTLPQGYGKAFCCVGEGYAAYKSSVHIILSAGCFTVPLRNLPACSAPAQPTLRGSFFTYTKARCVRWYVESSLRFHQSVLHCSGWKLWHWLLLGGGTLFLLVLVLFVCVCCIVHCRRRSQRRMAMGRSNIRRTDREIDSAMTERRSVTFRNSGFAGKSCRVCCVWVCPASGICTCARVAQPQLHCGTFNVSSLPRRAA